MNQLIAYDQWWNALLGGDPQETISARAGRQPNKWWARALCWGLDKLDPNHCEEAALNLPKHHKDDTSVLP